MSRVPRSPDFPADSTPAPSTAADVPACAVPAPLGRLLWRAYTASDRRATARLFVPVHGNAHAPRTSDRGAATPSGPDRARPVAAPVAGTNSLSDGAPPAWA